MIEDRACLSYWFPRLEMSGVRVPRTLYFRMPEPITPRSRLRVVQNVARRAEEYADTLGGFPVFLRTGLYSGKHSYEETCAVTDRRDLWTHADRLVEESWWVDAVALATNVWAVREMLKLEHGFTAFLGLPIATEARVTIRSGVVECVHPYWPAEAIAERKESCSEANWREILAEQHHKIEECAPELEALSSAVGRLFSGDWSLDWALSELGEWYAIDMAPAERSWHWAGCERGGTR